MALNLSRRNFLKSATAGLAGLVLSTNSSTEAQQLQFNPDNYRISYEEWEKAFEIYKKYTRKDVKNWESQLKETDLAKKASNIYNNPNAAYYALSNEEKKEELQMYTEHQNYIDKITNPSREKPNKTQRRGNRLADGLTNAMGEILSAPFKSLDSFEWEKRYYKEVYGMDIPVSNRNLNFRHRAIIYWEKKHKETYKKNPNKN
jgi:hypothetical protein